MKNKIAIVTGGAGEIGAAICRKLATTGYYVYINYRTNRPENKMLLDSIKRSGGKAELICFDITKPDDIQRAMENIKETAIDLLINSAGILKDQLIYKIDVNAWHEVLEVNYFGLINLYEAIKEKLSKSDSPVVISISSISGIKPRVGQASYAVSKSMIIEWTKRMAKAKNNKVKFYSISPGPVNTEMIKNTKWSNDAAALKRIPLGRYIEPDEIGEIVHLLTKNTVMNGYNIVYDGGFINTTNG